MSLYKPTHNVKTPQIPETKLPLLDFDESGTASKIWNFNNFDALWVKSHNNYGHTGTVTEVWHTRFSVRSTGVGCANFDSSDDASDFGIP